MNELHDVRTKWRQIGLGLLIPRADLDAIRGDFEECLERMLSRWLKQIDPAPTWERLIAVLRSRVVDENRKAQELEDKYCMIDHPPSPTPPADISTGIYIQEQ